MYSILKRHFHQKKYFIRSVSSSYMHNCVLRGSGNELPEILHSFMINVSPKPDDTYTFLEQIQAFGNCWDVCFEFYTTEDDNLEILSKAFVLLLSQLKVFYMLSHGLHLEQWCLTKQLKSAFNICRYIFYIHFLI